MEEQRKLELYYKQLILAQRLSAAVFKGLSLIFISLAIHGSSAWTSSGVAPFWLYETADGYFIVKMSKKAEQDDYDGVTNGAVKSKLFVYKLTSGNIQSNPTFITTSICESYRDPPERFTCSNATGPFSGSSYRLFSTYEVTPPNGKSKLTIASGKENPEVRKRMISLLNEYARTKDFRGSNGFFRIEKFAIRGI